MIEMMTIPQYDGSFSRDEIGSLDNLVERVQDFATGSTAPTLVLDGPRDQKSTHVQFRVLDNARERIENAALEHSLVALGFLFQWDGG
mmetsp:Transcript_11953/g.33102  ORF Transcript_11953/g.33102 Transcript_11953/m.33102 type:complete len:88 (+) Transcript_11953:346-609(+)